MTDVAQFDYDLPDGLIAAVPAKTREQSRLLCLERQTGDIDHLESFGRIIERLDPGDLLILNDARVLPARLEARRETGGESRSAAC